VSLNEWNKSAVVGLAKYETTLNY